MSIFLQYDHKIDFFLTASTISALTLFLKFLLFHVDLDSCLILNKKLLAAYMTNSKTTYVLHLPLEFKELFFLYILNYTC